MILGIVLFILLYIALVIFSVGLLVGGITGAYFLITFHITWITIVVGLGLILFGALCFFFTIKFIFSSANEEEPLQVEITKARHPLLFEYIQKLSKEVGTRFPKKIFLVPDVNASVSYNSSFWSMFLPVRKNLRIGLGLVNSLTLSEFKATIAHEFGHFSQRSMKTGSYVYTMNKIIYNLAYQRDDYDKTLEEWSEGGGWIGAFVLLTGMVVELFRAILHASYGALNITYMALSREMEYHADLVACSAAGNEAMVSTLRKIEFASTAYDATINELNALSTRKHRKVNDIYTYHSKMMAAMAQYHGLRLKDGLPIITSEDLHKSVNKSRLMIKDQWASHPSREEREANIDKVKVAASQLEQSAWALFNDPEATRKEMTQILYIDNPTVNSLAIATESEIDDNIKQEAERTDISPTFNGVFDSRWLSKFDVDKVIATVTDKKFEELLSTENAEMLAQNRRDAIDLETLRAIQKKHIQIKFFEFDGIRYKSFEAFRLVTKLEADMKKIPSQIQELDENICRYYYQRAKEVGKEEEFLSVYRKLAEARTNYEAGSHFMERIQSMTMEMQSRREWSEDNVAALARSVQELEKHVKSYMQELPKDAIASHFYEPDKVIMYLQGKHLWNNSSTNFNNESFAKLYNYITSCMSVVGEAMWNASKNVFDEQLKLTPAEFVKTR